MIYFDNVTAALAQADLAKAADCYASRAAYVAEFEAPDADTLARMKALPPKKTCTVVTSSDAFGYSAAHYGLTFEAPLGLSTESDASAADVAKLITQTREEKITAVFVETITDNRLMKQIVRETEAETSGTLYSDLRSGTDGPASTCLDMMRYKARTILQALGS